MRDVQNRPRKLVQFVIIQWELNIYVILCFSSIVKDCYFVFYWYQICCRWRKNLCATNGFWLQRVEPHFMESPSMHYEKMTRLIKFLRLFMSNKMLEPEWWSAYDAAGWLWQNWFLPPSSTTLSTTKWANKSLEDLTKFSLHKNSSLDTLSTSLL